MSSLSDRLYGCLIGGAIGDAFGAPNEDWHYLGVRERFGCVTEFLPQPARKRDGQPGQITDDTTLRHYLCRAIVRAGGRITPDDYAAVWLSELRPERLFATEGIVLAKLRLGVSPWDSGRGKPAADAAIMAVAPIGLINAGDPAQAYQDAFCVSAIHQDGLERDAAATMAATVAAFAPGATAATVLDAGAAHGTFDTKRLVVIGRDLATRTGSADTFIERFYFRYLDRSFPRPADHQWDADRSVSPTSREVLPIVVGLFQLTNGEPQAAIEAGRDADTICTLLGGLGGALHGVGAIRPDLIKQSEAANRALLDEVEPGSSFRSMADAMLGARRAERARQRARLDRLGALLEEG